MSLLNEQDKEKTLATHRQSKTSLYSSLFSRIYNKTHAYLTHLSTHKKQQKVEQEHLLIRGEKGSGKSLLIKQIAKHLADNLDQAPNTEVKKKPSLIVRLNEYEYGIRSIKDLCLRILSKLKTVHAKDLPQDFHTSADISWPNLIEEIQNANSRLILLIDNLDTLLKQLDKSDNLFFVKNILTVEQPYYRLIASCQNDSVLAQPFISFDIPPLDKALAYKLLISLLHKDMLQHTLLQSDKPNNQSNHEEKIQTSEYICLNFTAHKLEAIRRFSHANAQTLEYFYQGFLNNAVQTSYQYLGYVLGRYQAQYDFKMQHLSSQQQLIVHTLGSHWQAIKVAQLTKECDLASKTISAQLTQLEKQSWVEKVSSQNKNHFYRISDKRFHISYLTRFSLPSTQTLIAHSLNTLSYFSLGIPFMDEYKVQQEAAKTRSRLDSLAYQAALTANEDVSHTELDALFHHAFLHQGEEEVDGQAYCESASQYFKTHLPGERLSFLLTAASRGYEQAYLGLLSLFDLANTELEANLAYRIKLAICQLAQAKGFDFEDKLISLYLTQAKELKLAYQLSMQLVIIRGQKTEPLLLLQASFASLIAGHAPESQSLLRSYLNYRAKKEINAPLVIETEWGIEDAWLMELLLVFIANGNWQFLDQAIFSDEADNTHLKAQFLPLYHTFLAIKPQLSSTQLDEKLARPTELSEALPLLINAVQEARELYLD